MKMLSLSWKCLFIFSIFLVEFIESSVIRNITDTSDGDDDSEDSGIQPRDYELYFPDDIGRPIVAYLYEEKKPSLGGRKVNKRASIEFYLYTNANSTEPFQLYLDDVEGLKKSPFKPSLPTKLIIHGYSNTYRSEFAQGVKNAYLYNGKYNVIVINWGHLCKAPYYYTATKNTMIVGKYVANFIDMLVQVKRFKLSNLHIIGHSLGAHTSAIVCKHLTTGTVSRLTALDPAYPLYEWASKKWIVTENDAEFVDVIHTSGGDLGFLYPLGHIDFYPNGGTASQPGCGFDIFSTCSHSRSWEYFIESVSNPVAFPTIECESMRQIKKAKCNSETEDTPFMGEHATKTEELGLYYTKTRKRKPFAINQP